MDKIVIDGAHLTLKQVEAAARRGAKVVLSDDPSVRQRIDATLELNRELTATGRPIYGVTTGFGQAVNRQIGLDRTSALQANLIKFLGCGVGDYLSVEDCRAALLARVNCFAKGNSGVRLALIDHLVELLNLGVIPCIPSIGSVGASGDLIPSSYIAAVVMGEREVYHRGEIRKSADAYADVGLSPLSLEHKEGLALVNGTNLMTGIGILAVEDAYRLALIADCCTAMTLEALQGIVDPCNPYLHQVAKPHAGQIESASRIMHLLDGSALARRFDQVVDELGTLETGFRTLSTGIQESYSLRCAPHCIGALYDAIEWVRKTLFIELNSSNDNPIFDPDARQLHSGGNFSGFHVGLAMDTLKVAVASVIDLLDRQFQLVNDEKYNNGLGMCCTKPRPDDDPEAGLHHGFKGVQLAISAVAAEALNACMPMTVFSRSTACHNQDKVSMATAAARQAREIVDLAHKAAAMHLLILAQAADLRGVENLAKGTRALYEAIRDVSPFLDEDRQLDADIEGVVKLLSSSTFAATIEGV